VPDGWTICTLADLCDIKGGKRIPKGKSFTKDKTPYVYIRVTDMKKQTILLDDLKYIDSEVHEEIKNYIISSNDLYLTIAGTIGAVGVVPECLDGMNLTENAARLTNIKCAKTYLMYALLATSSQEHFSFKFHQVAQPKLSIETASSTPILLPPLNEQNRIIKEISRIWNIIDSLEQATTLLQKDIAQTKQTILSLAISGKLVPQDPTDEPAIDLLKRINPEFKPCDNSHYPFELPAGWTLSTFGTLNEHKSKSVNPMLVPSKKYELYSVPIFETGKPEFSCGQDIGSSKQMVLKDEILVCKINPHLNRVWKVMHYDRELPCIASSEWIVFSCQVLVPDFAVLYFQSPLFRDLLMSNVSGVGGSLMRARPSAVDSYPIPIPPIREQIRIVKLVSSLNNVINDLSQTIITT